MKENRDHSTLHPTPEKLSAYLRNELDNREAHLLEKHLLDCDFCAEGMEGLEETEPQNFEEDVAVLKASIEKRSRKVSPYRTYGIAAAISLVIAATFILINRQTDEILQAPETAMESTEEITEESADQIVLKDEADTLADAPVITEETLIAQELNTEENPLSSGLGGSVEYKDELASGADMAEMEEDSEIAPLQSRSADPEPSSVQPASPGPVSEKRSSISLNADSITEDEISRAVAARRQESQKMKKSAPLPQLETTQLRTIYGNVYSHDDLEPLPGVTVVLKGTTTGAVTDADGNFEITIPPGDQILAVNYIGFVGTEIQLDKSDSIEISLDSDVTALREAVSIGAGEEKKEEVYRRIPRPSIGRKAFRTYLEDNLNYPQEALDNRIEGKVVLNVSFNEFGIIKNIEVLKGLGYGCDEEAVRLVREGPAWEPGEVNGDAVDSELIIRVKFEIEE